MGLGAAFFQGNGAGRAHIAHTREIALLADLTKPKSVLQGAGGQIVDTLRRSEMTTLKSC